MEYIIGILILVSFFGLAFYAAADPVDLRALSPSNQLVHRPKGLAIFKRLLATARANY